MSQIKVLFEQVPVSGEVLLSGGRYYVARLRMDGRKDPRCVTQGARRSSVWSFEKADRQIVEVV